MARENSLFAGAFVEALARSIVKRELRLTKEAQELIERELSERRWLRGPDHCPLALRTLRARVVKERANQAKDPF